MKLMKRIGCLCLAATISLGVMSGCSKKGSVDRENTIIVASKNYTEALILGNMFASIIEKNTNLNVERRLNLGGTEVAFTALKNNEVDLYPEYTGTAYSTVLKMSGENDSDKVYNIVKEAYDKEYKIKWLNELGFNNTYALAVRKDTAEKYNLKTYSDLAKISDQLVLGSTFEFAERDDGYIGLQKKLNMHFKNTRCVDGGLRYQALANGNSDVIDAFSTEGLLKMYELVVLEDDQKFFPPYYAAPIIRNEVAEKHPEVVEQLNRLGGLINEQTMIDLNYKVDKEGADSKKVAEDFLKAKGLI